MTILRRPGNILCDGKRRFRTRAARQRFERASLPPAIRPEVVAPPCDRAAIKTAHICKAAHRPPQPSSRRNLHIFFTVCIRR
jgi:hypothetical protein